MTADQLCTDVKMAADVGMGYARYIPDRAVRVVP